MSVFTLTTRAKSGVISPCSSSARICSHVPQGNGARKGITVKNLVRTLALAALAAACGLLAAVPVRADISHPLYGVAAPMPNGSWTLMVGNEKLSFSFRQMAAIVLSKPKGVETPFQLDGLEAAYVADAGDEHNKVVLEPLIGAFKKALADTIAAGPDGGRFVMADVAANQYDDPTCHRAAERLRDLSFLRPMMVERAVTFTVFPTTTRVVGVAFLETRFIVNGKEGKIQLKLDEEGGTLHVFWVR